MSGMDELRDTFFQECEDLLETLEPGFQRLREADDRETVNAVFRAVHSIKGGAGAFALDALVRFAHKFETTLDELRNGRIPCDAATIDIFLRAADVLADLVHAMRDGAEPDEGAIDLSLAELVRLIPAKDEPAAADPDFTPMTLDFGMDLGAADAPTPLGGLDEIAPPAGLDAAPAGPSRWRVRFAPRRGLYDRGNEPLLLLRALAELGPCETECDVAALRDLDALDPVAPDLAWTVRIETEAPEAAIRDVFDFVLDDCDLAIEAEAPAVFAGLEADLAPAPEIVLAPLPAPAAPLPAAPLPAAASLPAAAAEPAGRAEAPKQTIRVDLDRIERLVNAAGELVITHAMLAQRVEAAGLSGRHSIAEGLDELKMLVRDLQDCVMSIRAQPVKPLFQRMTRIVREAAAATGKTIRLVTEGEDTEVDKTIVERLADPLTHMIRNAADHGIESAEKRAAAGKPAEGAIRLSAAQRSGRILIEVADDGGGINRERVFSIAVEKGLVPAGSALTESEIDNLLFLPGFSTAKEVSNLSGRGVGMDVVKRAIQELGGRVAIASAPGRGSTFSISLPLTLAVLDGLLVRVGDQTLVLPLAGVVETFRPAAGDVKRLGAGRHVALVRGVPIPVVDIGADLGFRPPLEDPAEAVFLVAETETGARRALVVDDIVDQRQVVIKGLEANFGAVRGVAAATILGDGRIALILDLESIAGDAGGLGRAEAPALAG